MSKLFIIAGIVVGITAVCFSVFVLGNTFLLKHNNRIALQVRNMLIEQIIQQVNQSGEVSMSAKDVSGKEVKLVLVKKVEQMPLELQGIKGK